MNTRDRRRPRITLSYAQTLDGRLATRGGSSQWIGGPESLVFAHTLRAQHDAIMVGVNTVLIDNPRLTVRHITGRDPLRVVVDSALRTPLTAAVIADGAAAGTLIAVTSHAPADRIMAAQERGARVLVLPADDEEHVDLQVLLYALHEHGIATLMVEGGAMLLTALLRARLADRLAVCVAPKILGIGIEAVGELGITSLPDALRLEGMSARQYGADLVISGDLRYPAELAHG
jgi:5-amino-6-(5-phosphoribosylamino)uracil reductase/diaminohydroxyphosphoribosylaminopyrimidine deaminase/5-amino-6-(5-phosphoribosylamino)uracil reductase